jgi:hypothetical protein
MATTHIVEFTAAEKHVMEWLRVTACLPDAGQDELEGLSRAVVILNLISRLVASIEMQPPVVNPTEAVQ